jgi:hypothetical protein
VVESPLVGIVPGRVDARPGLQLAVMSGGVNMPVVQQAQPVEIAADEEHPVGRTSNEAGTTAFIPDAERPMVPVPVYPRKQARH